MSTYRGKPRTAGLCLLAGIGLATTAPSASASTSTASTCRASAIDLTLLGAADVSAAQAGGTPCTSEHGGVDLSALGTVQASVVDATTDATGPATATAQVAGLHVGTDAVAAQLTAPLLSGSNSLLGQVTTATSGLLGPSSPLATALAPLSALGLQITGVDASALLASTATSLPSALESSLPSILDAGVINSVAKAQCVNGQATLSGSTDLTGVSVLGTAIDPDNPAAQALTLNSEHLTLSQLVSVNDVLKSIKLQASNGSVIGLLAGYGTYSLYDVLVNPGGLLGTVNGLLPIGTTVGQLLGSVNTVLQPVLDAHLDLPDELLHATATPRSVVNDGSTVTATTLQLAVTVLGNPVLSGDIARSTVSASAVDCGGSVPTPTPTPTPTPKPTPTPDPTGTNSVLNGAYASIKSQLQLQCGEAPVRLTDVKRSADRTLIRGVAEKRFVGQKVTIVLAAGSAKVATTTVQSDGSFEAKADLPPAKIRATSKARYYATVSGTKSNSLKFTRRMDLTQVVTKGATIKLSGRITLPRAKRQAAVIIQRRVSCTKYVNVATVKPSAKGKFSLTLNAPSGYGLYRAQTMVPRKPGSKKRISTYTLPQLAGQQ